MTVKPIFLEPISEQFRLQKRLLRSNAKLSSACKLATVMSFFTLVATVEMNINDGDASPGLIVAFVISASLLITTTVFVRIVFCWVMPRFETAALMSKYTIEELDRVPHENLLFLMDIVWMLATTVGYFLFVLEFILLSWIKFQHFTKSASYSATIIMTPVLIGIVILAATFYKKLFKRTKIIREANKRRRSSLGLGSVHNSLHKESFTCDCDLQLKQLESNYKNSTKSVKKLKGKTGDRDVLDV